MKNLFEHIKGRLTGIVLTALVATVSTMLLSSCSDDDEMAKTPLDAASIMEGAKTVSTLAFSWSPVAGATQYAYELADPNGQVVLGGMTNKTSLLATGLKVNTTYTLSVWSYAALSGDKSTSPIATLQATTNDVVQLSAPEATWEQTTAGIVLTWPAVEHASYYSVSYYNNDELSTVTSSTNSVLLQGLSLGDHNVVIQAISEDENYSNSLTFEFTVTRSKIESWRTDGEYYSTVLDQTFSCQIVGYDDGTYRIDRIYGSDDALDLYVDEGSVIDGIPEAVFTNSYSAQAPYYYFHAGDYNICIYYQRGTGYTGWENGNKVKGQVWYYIYLYDKDGNYLGGDYDIVTWGPQDDGGLTIDDIVGDYTEVTNCYDLTYDWTNWTEVTNQESDVKIEKIDDNTISIYNFYSWEDTFTAKVDFDLRQITIDVKDDWAGWYTFCQYDAPDTPVVGTIAEDGTITISNWTIWYAPNSYSYVYTGATSVLTKK
ncbi:MAG: hypothetical protein ACI3Y0_04900 [Prevotella sp.]